MVSIKSSGGRDGTRLNLRIKAVDPDRTKVRLRVALLEAKNLPKLDRQFLGIRSDHCFDIHDLFARNRRSAAMSEKRPNRHQLSQASLLGRGAPFVLSSLAHHSSLQQ